MSDQDPAYVGYLPARFCLFIGSGQTFGGKPVYLLLFFCLFRPSPNHHVILYSSVILRRKKDEFMNQNGLHHGKEGKKEKIKKRFKKKNRFRIIAVQLLPPPPPSPPQPTPLSGSGALEQFAKPGLFEELPYLLDSELIRCFICP